MTFVGKGPCDAHGAIAHRKVKQFLRSRSEKTEYRKVCTPLELAQAIASDGGLQNGAVQLLDVDRQRLREVEQVLAKAICKAKEYFYCASVYSYEPNQTTCNGAWNTAKYTINVLAYAGISSGATFQVNLQGPNYFELKSEGDPSDEETSDDDPSDEETTDDDGSDDEATEGDRSDDEATEADPSNDEATEADPSDDEATEGEPSDDEATEDDPSDDEATKDDPSDDEATEGDPSDDEATEDDPSNDDDRFVFLLGGEDEEDYDEADGMGAGNIGELAIGDLVRSLGSRELGRAKYTGPPQEAVYKTPLSLTGTKVRFHQSFGNIISKKQSEKQNQQLDSYGNAEEARNDLISRALTIAHAEIKSGLRVKIRDQMDNMEEYSIANASKVSEHLHYRKQGWARRENSGGEDGMYGAKYMTNEYKAVIEELFNEGVKDSSNKTSPAQMREEIEIRFPGFYTYPGTKTKEQSQVYSSERKESSRTS